MNNNFIVSTLVALLLILSHHGRAQMPLIDRGVQVEGLWCFPIHGDTLHYIYLPYEAAFAKSANNLPQFSMMHYVLETPSNISSTTSIQKADGGAILNFLVHYATSDEKIAAAQKGLQKRMKNDSIRIRGPLVFDKGRYALISSIINGDSLVQKKQWLASGNAPVLEYSRIALSFGLTPLTSDILMENFKMNTPDVSLVFDMEFSGLTEDYDAELEVDWTEVKKQEESSFGGTLYVLSADVKMSFDSLLRNHAIKLKVNGSNPNMEALLNTVYDKLLTMMFEPVDGDRMPAQQQSDLASTLVKSLAGGSSFGINYGYKRKELKSSGKSKLYFKGRSTTQRHHFITFNVGNLYKQYGQNKTIFREASIGGHFMKRSIAVGIDGDLEKEFDKILNSVTVVLTKDHVNGDKTTQDVLINHAIAQNKDHHLSLVYGYHQDSLNWMQYKHRCTWQFKGGATYESEWKTQDASMINVYVPFKRKVIKLEGDAGALQQRGIRAVSVQITYPFFSKQKQERITFNTTEVLQGKVFEITQPDNQEEVSYAITWIKTNGQTIQRSGIDKIGMIFIDELPQL